ncbi:MAG: hypothetical protein RIF33_06535 [Cyclobacteriaceae bacterium]
MDKKIRLNHSIQIPDKIMLLLLLFLGSGYLFVGINSFLEGGRPVSGTWNTSFGLFIIAYGVTYFGFYLPWTPQVSINEETIIIRPGVFVRTAVLHWTSISELKLGIRKISFLVDGVYMDFKLSTSASVSKDVKRALREAATTKSIPVVGG